jgi:ATP-dependent DNA ligase
MDLEGIVCKQKDSPDKMTEKPSRYWIKVKNSRYTQLAGRAVRTPVTAQDDCYLVAHHQRRKTC